MIITQYMQSKYGIGNGFANLLKIAIDEALNIFF